MSTTPTISLGEAFRGPSIVIYGNRIQELNLDASHIKTAGILRDETEFGFALIHAFRIGPAPCQRLPKPLLMSISGPGQQLTAEECGFNAGEVMKWSYAANIPALALAPSQGEISALLSAAMDRRISGKCACEDSHGPASEAVMTQQLHECVSLTISNGQACLNIPIYGQVCIPVPGIVPSGTLAEACIDTCSKWGIPCDVKVSVSIAGNVVAGESFGCC